MLGLHIGNQSKAYPVSELEKNGQANFVDEFAGQKLTVEYNSQSQSVTVFDAQKNKLAATMLFWFAWYAFYPDTELFIAQEN